MTVGGDETPTETVSVRLILFLSGLNEVCFMTSEQGGRANVCLDPEREEDWSDCLHLFPL